MCDVVWDMPRDTVASYETRQLGATEWYRPYEWLCECMHAALRDVCDCRVCCTCMQCMLSSLDVTVSCVCVFWLKPMCLTFVRRFSCAFCLPCRQPMWRLTWFRCDRISCIKRPSSVVPSHCILKVPKYVIKELVTELICWDCLES